jgi:hypothetical protein
MNKYARIAQLTGSVIDPATLERMVNDPRYSLVQIAAACSTAPATLANLLVTVADESLPLTISSGDAK